MSRTETRPAPAAPADDFDAGTPPPRRRRPGDAVPRFVWVPPGESVPHLYRGWDAGGRVPAGSALCDFVGTLGGGTGYRVALDGPLGAAGRGVPADDLAAWRIAAVVSQGARFYVVLVRPGSN